MIRIDEHFTLLSFLTLAGSYVVIAIARASLDGGQERSRQWDAEKLREREERARAQAEGREEP